MIAYNDKRELIPSDKFLFSVTQINEFFAAPNEFFRKVILKEDIPFATNATALGTLCHYAISQAHLGKEVDMSEVKEYLHSISEFNIDYNYIIGKFNEMKDEIVYNAVNHSLVTPTEVEQNHILQLTDNVYIGGTLDARYDNVIIDYKTTSARNINDETTIPSNYLNQLCSYAYILHKENIAVDKIAIHYMTVPETNRISEITGKRMKDYPCRYVKIEQYLNQDLMNMIENKIKLISSTIEFILAHPDSFGLFARDMELKYEPRTK